MVWASLRIVWSGLVSSVLAFPFGYRKNIGLGTCDSLSGDTGKTTEVSIRLFQGLLNSRMQNPLRLTKAAQCLFKPTDF